MLASLYRASFAASVLIGFVGLVIEYFALGLLFYPSPHAPITNFFGIVLLLIGAANIYKIKSGSLTGKYLFVTSLIALLVVNYAFLYATSVSNPTVNIPDEFAFQIWPIFYIPYLFANLGPIIGGTTGYFLMNERFSTKRK